MKSARHYSLKLLLRLYLSLMVLVIFFALLITVARLATPVLKYYRDNIAQWTSSIIQKPVEIGRIEATWSGFSPAIDFHNVAVLQQKNKEVLFFLKDFQVSVNLLQSLFARRWVIDKFYANGMKMVVIQKADKSWYVKGLQLGAPDNKSLGDMTEKFSSAIEWILFQPSIQLEDINFIVMPYNSRTINLSDIDLTVTNSDNAHYLRGQAKVGDKRNSPINIALDLTGDAHKIDALQGNFYLQGTNVIIDNWLTDDDYYGFSYTGGKVSFKLWGDWENNKVNHLQATLGLSHLKLTPLKSKKPLLINQLEALLSWQQAADASWQVTVDEKNIIMNNKSLPDAQAGLWFDKPTKTMTANIVNLSLSNINVIMVNSTLIPQEIQMLWQALQAEGMINKLQVVLQGELPQLDNYHLMGDFDHFGINEYQSIPGISNVAANFNITNTSGSVQVTSKDGRLSDLKLFKQPFALQTLNGIVQWQSSDELLDLQAYDLELKTPDIALQTNFSLRIPQHGNPYMSLAAQFQEVNLGKVQQFFPAKILAPKFMYWVDHAFMGGKSVDGKILLQGDLDKYPFIHNEGQYLSQLTINQLDLNFADGWPKISKLSGLLTFHKNMMNLTVDSGQIYGNSLNKLSANIPDLNAKDGSHLFVEGLIVIPDMAKAKEFIQKSPLQKTVGLALKPLVFQGNGTLDLKLNIPLDSGITKTDGKLAFNHLQLALPDWRLNFSDVTGNIYFTQASLSSSPMTATFFKQPAKIVINTLVNPNEKVTRVSLDSQLMINDLKKYFGIEKLTFMDGQTPFTATVDISSIKPTHIAVHTYLTGVKINLPKPYFKGSNEPHEFQLDAYLIDNQPPLVRMEYHDLLGVALAFTKNGPQTSLTRAQIHLGAGGYLLQPESGLFITGKLNYFDWQEWQPILAPYLTASDPTKKETSADPLLKKIDVRIGRLVGYKQQLKQAHVIIDHQPPQWKVALDSNNIVGALTIADKLNSKGIQAGFTKLYLTSFGGKANAKNIDPATLFPIQINADSVNYAGKDFGTLALTMTPVTHGVKIAKLSIKNKLYQLDTQGLWLRIKGQDHSTFTGNLTTDNLGDVLKAENFTTHLSGAKGHAGFSLSWPDSPGNFQTTDLVGDINAEFTDGNIVGLDKATNEKIGFGKLINLLSVQSIISKLTLNFKDLNKDGFYFSKAKGRLDIDNGALQMDQFYLDGPVAEIYISGLVGLKLKNYDLIIKINPYFTSSLPLIATIVGGPIVGAATWAASKVVRYGIEKAIVYEYHVGGTWKDPLLTTVNKKSENELKAKNATH